MSFMGPKKRPNPLLCTLQSQPRPSGSSNQLERLTTRLDDMEAKCHYCGSKMDSLLSALQEEVTELPDLTPSAENTIYLSLAGLKQVRVRYSPCSIPRLESQTVAEGATVQ